MSTVTFELERLERLASRRHLTYMSECRACGTLTPDGLSLTFDTDSPCWLALRAASGQPTPPAQPLPRDQWPAIVRAAARLAKPEDRGIGDVVRRLVDPAGGRLYKRLVAALGYECRCEGRRRQLNSTYPLV